MLFLKNIPEIGFGKLIYNEYEGMGAYVLNYEEVTCEAFFAYTDAVKAAGFDFVENHCLGVNFFYTYKNGSDAVYLCYYPNIKEMRIITEENSAYLDFADECGRKCTTEPLQETPIWN